MQVREITDNLVGHTAVLIEADNFPFYIGLIGTVEKNEKEGFIFSLLERNLRNGKVFHAVPLKPSDMIEPL